MKIEYLIAIVNHARTFNKRWALRTPQRPMGNTVRIKKIPDGPQTRKKAATAAVLNQLARNEKVISCIEGRKESERSWQPPFSQFVNKPRRKAENCQLIGCHCRAGCRAKPNSSDTVRSTFRHLGLSSLGWHRLNNLRLEEYR
ncbi:hypothetical protein J6590_069902 [Homalodisca vitripennis]|nr:hypothetical protein J6590_069902 [Homalodisca vitripennis]